MLPSPLSSSSSAIADVRTTSSDELRGIRAPESGTAKVRVTLVIADEPKLMETKNGTHKMELDCQNDDEEGVRVIAWRQDAVELSGQLQKGDLVQFSGLSVKKVFNFQYTYGALAYELHYSTGKGASSSYFVVRRDYRIAGMPLATLQQLDADIEFLRNSVLDRRVRTRRVKVVVCDPHLQQFCKGVIGSVIAYDPSNQSRTLPMRLQIDVVPEQYRQQLKRGLKMELRGKLSLPQLEGEPVEFKVEGFEQVDLTDNGVIPWLKGEKSISLRLGPSAGDIRAQKPAKTSKVKSAVCVQAAAVADGDVVAKKEERRQSKVEHITLFKGVVVSDFESMDTVESTKWGLVYIKEMQSAVSVIVSSVPEGEVEFTESMLIEMRGELKSDGDAYQVYVAYPAIAKAGLLPKPKPTAKLRAAAKRIRFADLQQESSFLQVLEGKVLDLDVVGGRAAFDLFVKDATGKGMVSVVVDGAIEEGRLPGILNKVVDVKGENVANDDAGFVFKVASMSDVVIKDLSLNGSSSSASAPNSPALASLKFNFDALSTMSPPTNNSASTGSARSAGSLSDAAALAEGDEDNDVQIVASVKVEENADLSTGFASMNGGGGRIPLTKKRGTSATVQTPHDPSLLLAANDANKAWDFGELYLRM